MEFPKNLKYNTEHIWVKVNRDNALIGVTDYAQDQLGDIIYVDLPEPGYELEQNESFGTIESAKSVSELYAPVSGHVVRVNESLKDEPELVNEEPYDSGWLLEIKLTNENDLNDLMDNLDYEEYLENNG
ncbi:MAG: glycine cleavage system protein GcvH [Candidatus Acidulodesulfobacterium ferriphilum]|jgi:glycine cleavage system H protein|uniref:Glycine cleavage system H protein n=1 Tax=Candidatus Acidulodesulfobacterium ferriphilum TaxID=2597223 RepID=A0A519B9Z2_9DELT|nr:MAG: glycine cleavage system protein GcvH [Candidatus Acidulodesulfobacterium ferriphilum]